MAASLCSPKPKRLRSKLRPLTAHDGQGLTLAHTAGLRTGCITGRQSSALLRRAHEMNMEFIYMKQALKMPAYEEIVRKAAVSDSVVAYVGDYLPDLPVMRRVGLAIAVGNAVQEVKQTTHYTTKAVDIELSSVRPGAYSLGVRQLNLEWTKYPIRVF